ncbi:MAG: DUF2341 domain-containing protein [Sphingobacteriaceae bacterium]|nr:DUF2341 domain-containing protein [Sphingobacteriaceae bacterium]
MCCLLIITEVSSQSTICNYKYRKRISFNPAQVAGPIDLTNFPAMIKITADNDLRTVADGGHVESASGFDLIFTAADGVTLLNFQMEYYASAAATGGSLTAWVRIPSISTTFSTDIYMYYGNTAIVTDQSSTTIWSGYYGVWHLQNNSFSDNSGNSQTLTNNGTTNQSPAFVNDGRANNGTRWMEVANTFPNITTNFSISGWAYTTNVGTAGQRIFCDDVNNSGGYALSIGDPGSGRVRFYSRGSNPVSLDTPASLANNTWYYFVAVANITSGVKTIYINGVAVATGAFVNAWSTDNGNSSIAGETAGGETANRLNGRIDEVRVASSALSADWILTEYNNQSSPSTFYSISAEPNVWTGGTSIVYTTNTNWLNNSVPVSGNDVIINNGTFQPTLQGNEQVGSLWIKTSAILSLGNNSLSVRYDITNCGTLSNNTGTVVCNSTSAYTQIQHFSGSGTYNLKSLTLNNTHAASPSMSLSTPVTVNGTLQLSSGVLYSTATNILSLSNTAVSSSGLATSFVSGPMSKNGATDFVFPVGKGTKWRRCAVTNISASDTYTAEYFNSSYASTTPVNAPLNHVSVVEYWQVDRAGAGNANLTLYWEDASVSGITNCPDLTIARWNGVGTNVLVLQVEAVQGRE